MHKHILFDKAWQTKQSPQIRFFFLRKISESYIGIFTSLYIFIYLQTPPQVPCELRGLPSIHQRRQVYLYAAKYDTHLVALRFLQAIWNQLMNSQ
jgi:hypothetical protein